MKTKKEKREDYIVQFQYNPESGATLGLSRNGIIYLRRDGSDTWEKVI